MPRLDPPLPEKLNKFRELSGENIHPSTNQQERSDKQNSHMEDVESDTLDKNRNTSIDFSLYLKKPRYTLGDVILTTNTRQQVDSIITEMNYQDLICNEWGMNEKHKLDKALSINFSGPPGTGKTIVSESIADALNLKILIVPYDLLESKYVGETPKNIVEVFRCASEHNALLFFDEADSFLGKRLETVTQSTDTAVNLTRSVMITQLSAYEGIVIFATNLVHNYDPAFISRIRWKVKFDLPDQNARESLWRIQIPDKLPLDNDVDFCTLASEFEDISGRDIKNAVFKAVVYAAQEDKAKLDKKVTQSHFRQAIKEIVEYNNTLNQQKLKLKPVEEETVLPLLPSNLAEAIE